MQDLKIIFGIDRAGFVGEDGESHQGVFDTSYLNSVPGLTVYAPSDYEELALMFVKGIYRDSGAVAVRYPRGKAGVMPENYEYNKQDAVVFGDIAAENCIVTYGREFSECYRAFELLDNTFILKLNMIKPITPETALLAKNAKNVFFFEEAVKTGGIGESFAALLEENGIHVHYSHTAIDDEFVKQASVASQLQKYKLDTNGVLEVIKREQENKA